MAKEEKEKPKSSHGEGKHKKHLHQIITTRAHDGSFGHEHVYKDSPHDDHSHPPIFAGTSSDMSDLHAHMDDHFGGGGEAGGGEAPEETAEAGGAPEAQGEPGPEAA